MSTTFRYYRIFIRMTIREGALTAAPAQDKIIRDYLDNIRNVVEKVLYEKERLQKPFLMKLLSKFESGNLSMKRGVKLTTRYIFNELDNRAGYFDEQTIDKHFVIVINMAHCVMGLHVLDEMGVLIHGFDWEEFYSTFIHEYKHFLQFLHARKSKVDPFAASDNTDYFDKPHEQQAWAEGYLEKLKHQLSTTNSAVILNFLRTNALSSSPSLRHLKQANPSAWKKIMKQAVLAAVRDANQKQ